MKLTYKLNITARFQRMNIKLKGRYSVFPLRTKATSINAPDSMKKVDLIIENAKFSQQTRTSLMLQPLQ